MTIHEILRKQLYPAGPKTYPTLSQKHFNGSDTFLNCEINSLVGMVLVGVSRKFFVFEEAVVLALWLENICLQIAEQHPGCLHASLLGDGWID